MTILLADVGLVDVSVHREDSAPSGDVKDGIYRDFIYSARFFAERARQLEQNALRTADDVGLSPGSAAVRHRAYVTGAILSAVAFLEASINELYLELHGARGRDRKGLPRRVAAVLGRFWSHAENAPILQRYQVVLDVADAERFDERRAPFQDADSLMKLRDALTHTRPERTESRRRVRALEQRLHERFDSNPLAAADSPWFPDLCLSTECAEWAVDVASAFSMEFCRRMSLPPRGLEREVEIRPQSGDRPARRTTPNGQSPYAASPNESRTRDER